jgi:hypothetical protein
VQALAARASQSRAVRTPGLWHEVAEIASSLLPAWLRGS